MYVHYVRLPYVGALFKTDICSFEIKVIWVQVMFNFYEFWDHF